MEDILVNEISQSQKNAFYISLDTKIIKSIESNSGIVVTRDWEWRGCKATNQQVLWRAATVIGQVQASD